MGIFGNNITPTLGQQAVRIVGLENLKNKCYVHGVRVMDLTKVSIQVGKEWEPITYEVYPKAIVSSKEVKSIQELNDVGKEIASNGLYVSVTGLKNIRNNAK